MSLPVNRLSGGSDFNADAFAKKKIFYEQGILSTNFVYLKNISHIILSKDYISLIDLNNYVLK